MYTMPKRSQYAAIPRYSENAVLQLIIASGVTFVMYHFTRIIMLILGVEQQQVFQWMVPNTALPELKFFLTKCWTILTYGWIHAGFWDWFTNMIWLFSFGSVLQSMVGHRQIIPLYILGLIGGGIFYLLGQFIPGTAFQATNAWFTGAHAGITALAAAAIVLTPNHRMQFSATFSIPLGVVLVVYLMLNLLIAVPDKLYIAMIHVGGAVAGTTYAMQLRRGYRPGDWIYNTLSRVERIATPDEEKILERRNKKRNEILRTMYEAKGGITQQRIDEILDKIIDKGYHSLTREERDVLLRASKD